MKIIKNTIGNEVKVFAETFENEAYEQVKTLVSFEPYQNAKIRIMPDSHAGKGCTIGTTMTIADKITPNLVGVDISCGILVVELQERNRLKRVGYGYTRTHTIWIQYPPYTYSFF